jgi:hypothetical protein
MPQFLHNFLFSHTFDDNVDQMHVYTFFKLGRDQFQTNLMQPAVFSVFILSNILKWFLCWQIFRFIFNIYMYNRWVLYTTVVIVSL